MRGLQLSIAPIMFDRPASLARIIGNLVDSGFFRFEDGRGAFFSTVLVSEIVLGTLASLIVFLVLTPA